MHAAEDITERLEDIHDLDGVIVKIAEEYLGLGADQHRDALAESPDLLTERPNCPAQMEDIPLDPMYLRDIGRSRINQEPLVYFLDPVADPFNHLEVLIHHGVHQGIGEIIGVHQAEATFGGNDSLPDLTEHITPALLEGDHEIVSKN
jgi:hypothetical protein